MPESKSPAGSVPSSEAGAALDSAWQECLRKAAAGDESGLAALYDQSSSLVFALALRITGNRADAEEVTLDVYTQVWRTAGAFDRGRSSVASWLLLLARSRAIDKLRSRASRTRLEEPEVETARLPSGVVSPEESAAIGQIGVRVRDALGQLAPEQREVIELAYYSGYTHAELAEHLGQPVGTVKTRIRLGMIKLRAALSMTHSAMKGY